ncbi:MAG: NADH-quinone oxidoreductase subunit A [Candidatus Sumerlaeaceae bacterium]|nr:NADH-quinone oxidoreductase subunit A [Candidatus Sumerlaeaceae bacterium]
MDHLLFNFGLVAVFLIVGFAFVYGALLFGSLLRPRLYGRDKMRIYECGEPTIGSSWIRYNIRFYMVALVFLIFDVEIAFLFPVASVITWFRDAGLGLLAYAEIVTFVVILLIGFAYAWRYGNLDWISPEPATGKGVKPPTSLLVAGRAELALAAQRSTAAPRTAGGEETASSAE